MRKFSTQLSRYFSQSLKGQVSSRFDIKNDKYNAIHLTPKQQLQAKLFDQYITTLLRENSQNGTTSIWVHLNGPHLSLISNLINLHGFKLHRSEDNSISLYRWILKSRKDMVVPYSMFHVGCGGVIIHDNSILLIEEKRGELKGRFGIPGGRADFGEGIEQCSERQVFEQIGVKSKFSHVLWLRQLSSYVYGSYDYYFACLMAVTSDQLKNLKVCDYEVEKAIWVPLKDYKSFAESNSFGTQLEFANYLHNLNEKGYDFTQHRDIYKAKRYQSQIDKKDRFFGQHRFASLQ